MIDKTAREYVGIVTHLLNQPDVWLRGGNLLIPCAKLREMLDKHPYRPAKDKLDTWRNLGWLIADSGHRTCRAKRDGVQQRVFCIRLEAYTELSALRELDAKNK